jgi:HEAT repeat protein
MRIVVLDAVRRVGPNAATATPFLIAALKHRLTAVVVGAANALGNIGPAASAAVQDLLELLDDDRSWVAPAALQALQKIVHNQDEIVAIVTPFVQQKHAISRYALDALGQITPTSEEILSELSTASRNEDPEIRAWAVQALGTIGPDARSELDVVMERLEDEDYTARGMAATAISNIAPNADETIATLIVRLEDPHWFVRSRAASALKQLGPTAERAIPSLRRLLSDENTTVRSIAAEAMKKIQLSASVEGE